MEESFATSETARALAIAGELGATHRSARGSSHRQDWS